MADYKKNLMSKNGRITMNLAKEMLGYDEGDRIKTIEQYASEFQSSRGTVQSAFKFLQSVGGIHLEARGHLGTFITRIDHKKLWEITDIGPIMGVMPLPYSKRYEGLATGLYKAFEEANIPFSLAFMRGSTKRIEALNMDRYHFAIMSKLTAELEMKKSRRLKMVSEFKEGSYVRNHVMIFRQKGETQIRDGMRVAIDPISVDQIILTNYECEGIDVEYIEVSYNQILYKLKSNEIDVAIWNGDELEEQKFEFNVQPLKNPKTKKIAKDDTIAAIIVNNDELQEIFNRFINIKEIEIIQDKVIRNEMIPVY